MAVAIFSSRLLLAALISLAGFSALSLAVVPIPVLIQILSGISMIAVCSDAIRRHALVCSSRSVTSIEPRPAGKCIVKHVNGEESESAILADSVAWSWMLLLRLAEEGRRRPVIVLILRDSVADEGWRRLSIWLRWQTGGQSA